MQTVALFVPVELKHMFESLRCGKTDKLRVQARLKKKEKKKRPCRIDHFNTNLIGHLQLMQNSTATILTKSRKNKDVTTLGLLLNIELK